MTQKFLARNPHDIRIPTHLTTDEEAVTKAISSFQADGIIPDITITEDGELIEGIETLEAAKRLEKQMVVVVIASSTKPQINVEWIPIELLDPHPLNAQIYGEDEDVTALAESISANGLQENFTITPKSDGRFTVIHGHRRRLACLKNGIKVVPVIVKNFSTSAEAIAALLSGNEYREKSIEQKSREYLAWLDIEKENAKNRQGRPNQGQGTTRDIIAKRVGLGSGVNAEHAIVCVKTLDETADAPIGTVRHQQHEQLKQLLSRTRGVDAAYKLVKPEPPNKPVQSQRWTPKEFERVKITGGPHKGSLAIVRIITGPFSAVCYIEGEPEDKRHQIAFNQMEAIPQAAPPTSVTQELKQQQQSLGLGTRTQILPDKVRNEGHPPEQQLPASITNINAIGEVQVAEMAIALLSLTPKQLFEVMSKAQPDFSTSQLEAIW
ncbi:MAG TPA: ParB N-terminal domain-containing protein, partial [Nostoc sp.]|uniref:ParB/RepB/Spo0J family partition protein n=1 Tax=Nostoc sp. TaxID=1180 RepID=UPI002D5EFB91